MTSTFLFDVSRLVSRIGQGAFTGIDRVELAYFREFLQRSQHFFAIARISQGYALLDKSASLDLLAKIDGQRPWGRRGIQSIRAARQPLARQKAEADIRRTAIAVSNRVNPESFARHIPNHTLYVNVGHTNTGSDMARFLDACEGMKRLFFIHDMIPADWPQFTRSDAVERFASFSKVVSTTADIVVCNSNGTRDAYLRHFPQRDLTRIVEVAHLGVERAFVDTSADPNSFDTRPYFVALGTIEPRKNIGFLLKIWREILNETSPDKAPHLHIIGKRGWMNETVFKQLDENIPGKSCVFEQGGLKDHKVVSALNGARALLFPSFIEGYGLPPLEAAALGTPVICGENAISSDVLGEYPLYLSLDDPYLWKKTIIERAGGHQEPLSIRQQRANTVAIPTWESHFERVFSHL
jgi:glycosyltransferase involved in cell wall biosynthesis